MLNLTAQLPAPLAEMTVSMCSDAGLLYVESEVVTAASKALYQIARLMRKQHRLQAAVTDDGG
jgi:hypothetical protein